MKKMKILSYVINMPIMLAISGIAISGIAISCAKNYSNKLSNQEIKNYDLKVTEIENKIPIVKQKLKNWYSLVPNDLFQTVNQIEKELVNLKSLKDAKNYEILNLVIFKINAILKTLNDTIILNQNILLSSFNELIQNYNKLKESNKYNTNLWLSEKYDEIMQLKFNIEKLLFNEKSSLKTRIGFEELLKKISILEKELKEKK
ncbi:hypothetical protein [Metamycoplasma canadense]|uniref:Lipoprotein n=1 Tax=Metamycoplasma canadense TaxID=29554 RepID=A0A077L976_9BACT|nr:hypothetical protein [Metamycoplasma canadense]BAP39578.1 hypothetical protein MCAN360_0431 [Metamycoplasma canadense]